MLQPKFYPFPELRTERLILRKITKLDAGNIFELRSSEQVMKYIDKPRATSIDDAHYFIQIVLENLAKNDGITWAIGFREMPQHLIGTIGLWRLIKENYRAEIGYMLHPQHWRKGLMKEAIDAVIKYGFNQLKLHSIEAHINPANAASDGILVASGFVREAYFKEDYYYNGAFLDSAIYSRLQ